MMESNKLIIIYFKNIIIYLKFLSMIIYLFIFFIYTFFNFFALIEDAIISYINLETFNLSDSHKFLWQNS